MRNLLAAAAILFAGSALAQTPDCAPDDLAETRAAFAEEFAAFRKAQGLPVLEPDPKIQAAVQTYACSMAETGVLSHKAPDGARGGVRLWREDYDWCRVGENLAVGQRDVKAALKAWANSPPHRLNLALDQVTEYGIGLAYADKKRFPQFDSTRRGSPVWVMMVARLCP